MADQAAQTNPANRPADSVERNNVARNDKEGEKPAKPIWPVRALLAFVEFVGEIAILTGQTVGAIVRGISPRDVLEQMSAIGVDSIGIVLVITCATGAVFSYYISSLTLQFGGFRPFIGGTVAYALMNELAPVLGGVGLAARSGAAIAAEIGSMVVTEQVDALRAMAVSPVRYLVAPRVIAAVVMLPLLIVLADIAGLAGAFVFASGAGISTEVFAESVHVYTRVSDMFHGLEKAVVFGFIVGMVACQQGLRTKGGATGVGRATTSSVVLCVVLIFVSDVFLAQILTK